MEPRREVLGIGRGLIVEITNLFLRSASVNAMLERWWTKKGSSEGEEWAVGVETICPANERSQY